MAESSSTWSSWLANLAYTGGSLAAGLLVLLYVYQDKLLYFPTIPGASKFTRDNPAGYRHPGELGIDYEDLMIRTKDNVHIHAWLMKQPDSTHRPTLIFFHGNAGNIGYRLPNAAHLYHKASCNVLLVDYRGFGHSEGEPNEAGLKLDAEAALDAMVTRTDIDPTKLVVFGRSLGGAVAVYLAKTAPEKIAGVILENTFLSISAMVDALMPMLRLVKPVVLRMDWNSEREIASVPHPILFIAGQQDELVPHSHMKTLYARATKSRNAVWLPIPNGTHNDTWLRGGEFYFAKLRHFLDTLGSSGETCPTPPSPPIDTVTLDSTTHEGAIPNMLQQPLVGSIMKKDKAKDE